VGESGEVDCRPTTEGDDAGDELLGSSAVRVAPRSTDLVVVVVVAVGVTVVVAEVVPTTSTGGRGGGG
jgi:hypothetical protein